MPKIPPSWLPPKALSLPFNPETAGNVAGTEALP